MSRSKWKGPFINFKTNESSEAEKQKKIVSRNSHVVPAFVGFSYNVHNGKTYTEVIVTENMIGHKFGEFVFTRAKFSFKKKKSKK